jgi:hypothetical protein
VRVSTRAVTRTSTSALSASTRVDPRQEPLVHRRPELLDAGPEMPRFERKILPLKGLQVGTKPIGGCGYGGFPPGEVEVVVTAWEQHKLLWLQRAFEGGER